MKKLLGIVVLLMPMLAMGQQAKIDGTWKIDLDKARLDSKPRVFELKGGMFSCMTCDPKITIAADGQDHAITGSPYMDSESAKVVDPNSVEVVGKKDGKVTFRETLTVSSDGKMMTENYEGHPVASSEPVTATGMYSRVGEPETGAGAISGSWKLDKWESASANTLTFVYASNGNDLTYKANTGESYTAKLDGKDYAFHGDPGTTAVEVKRVDDHTIQETYKRGNEVVGMAKMTISPDAKSLTIVSQDLRRGTTDTWIAEKQGETEAEK
jgi:hypothetical protein